MFIAFKEEDFVWHTTTYSSRQLEQWTFILPVVWNIDVCASSNYYTNEKYKTSAILKSSYAALFPINKVFLNFNRKCYDWKSIYRITYL